METFPTTSEAPGRGVSALNEWGDLAAWRDELRGTRGGAVGHSHGGGWGSRLLSGEQYSS